MSGPRIRASEMNRVAELSAEGLPVPQIAATIGRSRATVANIRRRLGIQNKDIAGRPPSVETARHCVRCGISFTRCKPHQSQPICVDCAEVEAEIREMTA